MSYKLFSIIYPKKIKDKYSKLLKYLEIKINPDVFIGFITFFGFGIALLLAFYLNIITKVNLFLLVISLFLSFEFLIYLYLNYKVDKKAKEVEEVLPDALQLMASNLRAGLTTEKALFSSARKEFGILQQELSRIGKEVATGKELGIALKGITKRIRSDKLEKTISLIVTGINAGGELSELLEQTSNNLKQQALMEKRVRSSVLMYVIFIFIAVGIGAPALYSLSSFLVEVLTEKIAIEIPQESLTQTSLPMSFSKPNITTQFTIIYTIISLITSSILSSLVLGLISKGKESEGMKYIPILIILTLTVFFITRLIIKSLLGGLFGF